MNHCWIRRLVLCHECDSVAVTLWQTHWSADTQRTLIIVMILYLPCKPFPISIQSTLSPTYYQQRNIVLRQSVSHSPTPKYVNTLPLHCSSPNFLIRHSLRYYLAASHTLSSSSSSDRAVGILLFNPEMNLLGRDIFIIIAGTGSVPLNSGCW